MTPLLLAPLFLLQSAEAEPSPVRVVSWSEEEGPEAREHGAWFHLGGEAPVGVLFGGTGFQPQFKPLRDLWLMDLSTGRWSPGEAEGELPSGGGSRRAVSLSGQAEALLFGGMDAELQPHDELYRVVRTKRGVRFERVAQENPPPPRFLHAFVHDEANERFLVFGGAGQGVLGDLWSMRLEHGTARWSELEAPDGPTPRYGFAYGYDARQQRLFLFSGADARFPRASPRDTWALHTDVDPPEWELLTEGGDFGTPPARRNACWGFDPRRSSLVVWGGTSNGRSTQPGLYRFDARGSGLTWTEASLDVSAPLRCSGMGLFDPAGGSLWLGFGNDAHGAYRDLIVLE